MTANRKNYRKFDFKFGYCLLTVYLLSNFHLDAQYQGSV